MKHSILAGALICMVSLSHTLQASELEISSTPAIEHSSSGDSGKWLDNQTSQHAHDQIENSLSSAASNCPPYCINPIALADDVHTVDELEVIKFIETSKYDTHSLMVDTRAPGWYQRGTIPGSVNIPYSEFEKSADDPELVALLSRFGAKPRAKVSGFMRVLESVGLFNGNMKTERWDFSDARDVLLWCNNPWCSQSPRAIKALLSHGYPAEKIYYYRGGMQSWHSLGLATVQPVMRESVASR